MKPIIFKKKHSSNCFLTINLILGHYICVCLCVSHSIHLKALKATLLTAKDAFTSRSSSTLLKVDRLLDGSTLKSLLTEPEIISFFFLLDILPLWSFVTTREPLSMQMIFLLTLKVCVRCPTTRFTLGFFRQR